VQCPAHDGRGRLSSGCKELWRPGELAQRIPAQPRTLAGLEVMARLHPRPRSNTLPETPRELFFRVFPARSKKRPPNCICRDRNPEGAGENSGIRLCTEGHGFLSSRFGRVGGTQRAKVPAGRGQKHRASNRGFCCRKEDSHVLAFDRASSIRCFGCCIAYLSGNATGTPRMVGSRTGRQTAGPAGRQFKKVRGGGTPPRVLLGAYAETGNGQLSASSRIFSVAWNKFSSRGVWQSTVTVLSVQ